MKRVFFEKEAAIRGIKIIARGVAIGTIVNQGIGPYEYWGYKCYDEDLVFEPDAISIDRVCVNDWVDALEFADKYPEIYEAIMDQLFESGDWPLPEEESEEDY